MGTSAAARVVLEVGSTTTAAVGTNESVDTEGATTAAAAAAAAEAFSVPKGLWCYRLDRYRVVLGGSLTDGGSVFDWLRHTLALGNNCVDDMNSVMREVEEMSPGSHELVVSKHCRDAQRSARRSGRMLNYTQSGKRRSRICREVPVRLYLGVQDSFVPVFESNCLLAGMDVPYLPNNLFFSERNVYYG